MCTLSCTKFMFLDTTLKKNSFLQLLAILCIIKLHFPTWMCLPSTTWWQLKIFQERRKPNSQFLKFLLQSQEGDAKSQKYSLYGVMCVQWFELTGELALKCLVMLNAKSLPTVYKEVFSAEFSLAIIHRCLLFHSLSP